MSLKSVLTRFFRQLVSLRKSEAGAIAVTYAVGGAMLVGIAFAGVDLSRMAVAQSTLQDALDSGTLAAGQTRSTDTTILNTTGRGYMDAVLSGNPMFKNLNSSFTPVDKKIVGLASADIEPIVLGLYTGGDIHIVAHSEVVRGQDQIVELALVLDTTGSMEGSKIDTLKVAAADLVTSVFNATDAGTVKVALVPFAQHVNMGIASRNEPWAIVPADVHEWVPQWETPSCDETNCTGSHLVACQIDDYTNTTCTGYNDGMPYTYSCQKKTGSHTGTCTEYTGCTTTQKNPCPGPVDNGHWHDEIFYGCYGSPPYPDNVTDNNPSRKYSGLMNYHCSSESIPLTTDKNSIVDAINSFIADGETYIPAGLAWGFNMLTKAQPMTQAMDYDTIGPNLKPRKILVLMTDGANTKQMDHGDSRGPHTVDASPPTEADQYTKELCDNIKAKGIEIYSVAFEITGNPGAKNLVKACASDNDHYFDATNQSALLDAFEQIALSIQNLRISH